MTPGVLAVAVIKSTNAVVEVPVASAHRLDEGDGDLSAD